MPTAFQLTATLPDGHTVAVAVTRKRVRNLNLRVHRDGSVTLSIPLRTSLSAAQAFLDSRVGWIARHRERVLARAATDEASRDAGVAEAPLWGKMVDAHAAAALLGIVEAAGGDTDAGDSTRLGVEQVKELYRRELTRVLPEVVAWAEPLIGVHATHWTLRSMKTRWGSCTPKTGRIRINLRLAAFPRECLEYVVVHELTHLLEPSHNERFHELVARVIPNEREIRARLHRGATG